MNKKNHKIFNLAVGISVAIPSFLFTQYEFFHILIGLYILWQFAMLPDFDQNISFFNHRGVSHTFIFAFGVGVFSYYGVYYSHEFINQYTNMTTIGTESWAILISTSIAGAYTLHIIGDMLTKGGGFSVKPFWPLSSWNGSIGSLKYNSNWFDVFTKFLLLLSVVFVLIVLDYSNVINIVDPVSKNLNRWL